MRESCKMCVLKHLAKAVILLSESQLGYPTHYWLAMGNLSEAEDEAVNEFPELAKEIRNLRLDIEIDIHRAIKIMGLIEKIEEEI